MKTWTFRKKLQLIALSSTVLCGGETLAHSQLPKQFAAANVSTFANTTFPRLRVSDDGRFLVKEDGSPFFWLGDTGWFLNQKPKTAGKLSEFTFQDIRYYLRDRASRGFTVIQGPVIVPEFANVVNPKGQRWSNTQNTNNLNEQYFAFLDAIFDAAEAEGLYVAPVVMWGQTYKEVFSIPNSGGGNDPRNLKVTAAEIRKANAFGEWLGNRYRSRNNLIWIVSGEYHLANNKVKSQVDWTTYRPLMEAVAKGLETTTRGKHLLTIHPGGHSKRFIRQGTSSEDFHNSSWLDFNTIQSTSYYESLISVKPHANARTIFRPNYVLVQNDYALTPVKPTLESEAGYEPQRGKRIVGGSGFQNTPTWDGYAIRSRAYWAILAGSFGYTYGNIFIYQFDVSGTKQYEFAPANTRMTWRQALAAEGGTQMRHVRALFESRPFQILQPDQSLVASPRGLHVDHVLAARASDNSYAYVYIPDGEPVRVAVDKIAGSNWVVAHWFNPRTGAAQFIGHYPSSGSFVFTPPSAGPKNDWVLVLDDSSKRYGTPGSSLPGDTDNDLLPDAWETSRFGNLNANSAGDADGDGRSNREEYLRGTSPVAAN